MGAKELNPLVLPFALNYPLWFDGAHKSRYVYTSPGREDRHRECFRVALSRGDRLLEGVPEGGETS